MGVGLGIGNDANVKSDFRESSVRREEALDRRCRCDGERRLWLWLDVTSEALCSIALSKPDRIGWNGVGLDGTE